MCVHVCSDKGLLLDVYMCVVTRGCVHVSSDKGLLV